ncbi:MAG: thiamine-monophosphate kinase [Opitutia bacterium]|nr:thiamine-monophosphate kinase [Opitutales bacterium]PHX79115.1 MAG: thiamine-monophosphate kinase [Opitutae bacterium]
MGALTTVADRSVAKLTEEELIRRVVQSLAEAAPAFPEGPGGDCAHLPTTGGRSIRASTIDSVILGRHFDAACDGIRAGAKLVNRNLSDLAAAGAVPSDALLSLVIGGDVDATWLTDFAHGAGRAAAKAGLRIVGGDICRGQQGTFVGTLALQGFAHRILTRRTAVAGDVLFVTGQLGGSLYGKHLDFTPRLAEGEWLCGHGEVTACTDLSDGLAKDLPGLLGPRHDARIAVANLPIAEAARILAKADGKPVLEHALQDGEDYELLFTVSASRADLLEATFRKAFPVTPLTRLGTVEAGTGLARNVADGEPLKVRGFGHFA